MIGLSKSIPFLVLALSVSQSTGARADGATQFPAPGVFDNYVFAMSYEEDFCVSHADKPECKSGDARNFGMALHGLWPNKKDDYKNNYQYCSPVTAQQIGSNWCAAPYDVSGQFDSLTNTALPSVMPGVSSCLYTHEWYAHGTCSAMDINVYFQTASQLAADFNDGEGFKNFLDDNKGGTVSRQDIIDALTADLGDAAADSIVVLCRKDGGKAYFQEVDITLNISTMMDFPAADSYAPSKLFQKPDGSLAKDQGNCPADGIEITADAS